MCDANASHTQVQASIEILTFLFMPGEGLCRRFVAPLCLTYTLMQERTHIR